MGEQVNPVRSAHCGPCTPGHLKEQRNSFTSTLYLYVHFLISLSRAADIKGDKLKWVSWSFGFGLCQI